MKDRKPTSSIYCTERQRVTDELTSYLRGYYQAYFDSDESGEKWMQWYGMQPRLIQWFIYWATPGGSRYEACLCKSLLEALENEKYPAFWVPKIKSISGQLSGYSSLRRRLNKQVERLEWLFFELNEKANMMSREGGVIGLVDETLNELNEWGKKQVVMLPSFSFSFFSWLFSIFGFWKLKASNDTHAVVMGLTSENVDARWQKIASRESYRSLNQYETLILYVQAKTLLEKVKVEFERPSNLGHVMDQLIGLCRVVLSHDQERKPVMKSIRTLALGLNVFNPSGNSNKWIEMRDLGRRSMLTAMQDECMLEVNGAIKDDCLLLGIRGKDRVSLSDVKDAYRKMALKTHPDKVAPLNLPENAETNKLRRDATVKFQEMALACKRLLGEFEKKKQVLEREDKGSDSNIWRDVVRNMFSYSDQLTREINETYADIQKIHADIQEIYDDCQEKKKEFDEICEQIEEKVEALKLAREEKKERLRREDDLRREQEEALRKKQESTDPQLADDKSNPVVTTQQPAALFPPRNDRQIDAPDQSSEDELASSLSL